MAVTPGLDDDLSGPGPSGGASGGAIGSPSPIGPRRPPRGNRRNLRPLAALIVLVVVAGIVVVQVGGIHLGGGQNSAASHAPGSARSTPLASGATAAPAGASTSGRATAVPGQSAETSAPPPTGSPIAGATSGPGASASPGPVASSHHFPGGLLIADEGNGRIIAVNDAGQILWQFPVAGSLPPGQQFSADDAFISPDGKSIVANEEGLDVIVRIDIATRKIVWEYGVFNQPGSGKNHLNTPDDAYPLANGDITVADIRNCRILEISPAKQIVRQWGQTGVCTDNPPLSYGEPNGDTPLPDGGMLITEITGSRVVRLSATGKVIFDIHVPVAYPSDAQLDSHGNVELVDYSTHGSLVVVNPTTGQLVYRYGPRTGPGRLNHPSLGIPLADGTYVLNDDFLDRVVVIDPTTNAIVWTYGHRKQASAAPGYLNNPDGVDPLPPGIFTSGG